MFINVAMLPITAQGSRNKIGILEEAFFSRNEAFTDLHLSKPVNKWIS